MSTLFPEHWSADRRITLVRNVGGRGGTRNLSVPLHHLESQGRTNEGEEGEEPPDAAVGGSKDAPRLPDGEIAVQRDWSKGGAFRN